MTTLECLKNGKKIIEFHIIKPSSSPLDSYPMGIGRWPKVKDQAIKKDLITLGDKTLRLILNDLR